MLEEPRHHLVFELGQSRLALPTDQAAEVVALPLMTFLPGAPAHVLGVFAHRGEVIPVLDVSVLLGGGSQAPNQAVILRTGDTALAFVATRVLGILPLGGAGGPLSTEGAQKYFSGPFVSKDGDVLVIDVEGLSRYLS